MSDCLGGIWARFSANPKEVKHGESTTLSWYVELPQGCPEMTYYISRVGYFDQQTARRWCR